ncbi:hypothetical protein FB451DRAFT_1174375 [Mycena latifolia]|nr:hypothetical protein FB451DRAFT_1174375 [Mycena latifolia]
MIHEHFLRVFAACVNASENWLDPNPKRRNGAIAQCLREDSKAPALLTPLFEPIFTNGGSTEAWFPGFTLGCRNRTVKWGMSATAKIYSKTERRVMSSRWDLRGADKHRSPSRIRVVFERVHIVNLSEHREVELGHGVHLGISGCQTCNGEQPRFDSWCPNFGVKHKLCFYRLAFLFADERPNSGGKMRNERDELIGRAGWCTLPLSSNLRSQDVGSKLRERWRGEVGRSVR